MPNWTNFHNKEAFTRLSEWLKKEFQWNSSELLFLELLARYSKTVNVDVKNFVNALPDKYVKNIPPNERLPRILQFFDKLSESGLVSVKHRDDETNQISTVTLRQPDTKEEKKQKELIDPALSYLNGFYRRRDFKNLLQDTLAHLPNPRLVQDNSNLVAGVLLSLYVTNLKSLVFSTKEVIFPVPEFSQEKFAASEKPFIHLEFPSLTAFDSAKRHNLADANGDGGEQPFFIVLPAMADIKDLIREFFVPLILTYLQDEKNKDVYKTIHHEWSKKLHASSSDSQLDPEARIEKTLLAADLNDGAYYASVHVLTHVLRHLKLRNMPAAPSPLIYESTRFIYDHAMACRQILGLERQRKAEQIKDQDIINDFLLKEVYATPEGASIPGPMPVTRKQIEDLPDCSKRTTLGLKYQSVRDLMPLIKTTVDQVPRVLEIDGAFIHRWHLVNHFILMQHRESRMVEKRLSSLWAETGIPRSLKTVTDDKLVSEEFVKLVQLMHGYRSGILIDLVGKQFGRELHVFIHYFFPSPEEARTNRVEYLLKASEGDGSGGRGPKTIATEDIDKTMYRDVRSFALRSYPDMLHLEYSSIKRAAADLARKRLGALGYFFFMLRGMFGITSEPSAANGAAKGSERAANPPGGLVNNLQNRPSQPRPTALTPAARKTIQELEDVLHKIPNILRIDIKVLQSTVDPLVKHLNPDIHSLGDEEARAFVKEFIAKAPKLNNLPYRADPIFIRYVLLVMRKNNL